MGATHTGDDLLDILARHEMAREWDYRAGLIAGMRLAACFVQDYATDRSEAIRLQTPMLRAITVAECDECNRHGFIAIDGKHVDHHPHSDVLTGMLRDQIGGA